MADDWIDFNPDDPNTFPEVEETGLWVEAGNGKQGPATFSKNKQFTLSKPASDEDWGKLFPIKRWRREA